MSPRHLVGGGYFKRQFHLLGTFFEIGPRLEIEIEGAGEAIAGEVFEPGLEDKAVAAGRPRFACQ